MHTPSALLQSPEGTLVDVIGSTLDAVVHEFSELHDHLLKVAATLLVIGGRLVFLFHTDIENSNYEEEHA